MARYIKDFQCSCPPQTVFNVVYNFLCSEKFEYLNFDGENVFKKGDGIMISPCFFKLTFAAGFVRLETWSKFAILPGVFAGEYGTTGMVGAATRGLWLKRLATVESIITSYGGVACPQPVTGIFEQAAAPVNNMFQQTAAACVCPNCRNSIQPNFTNCPVCGAPVMQAQPVNRLNVSRKEFIENYLPPSEKRNINSVAILCYVCAALTAAVCLFMNPWGLIDAGILFAIALGMQLTKSRVFAILLLIFSIIEFILTVAVAAAPPVWWLVAGIAAVVIFNKIEKKYKQFKGQG